VVVGGELTLDNLEIRHDPRSNTCEAPLQMKSNCGCLLIDDFGRQRVAPAELLNRWIVPLESRHDFLSLPTGKKFSVPFEQTILFSTNLQPEQLVDEAFLRRVPFKIHIGDPSIEEFMDLFKRACEGSDVPWRPDAVEKLITKHYRNVGRPLRRCHPRDLLHQVKCLCTYRGERVELRPEFLDLACTNYFGNQPIMQSSSAMAARPVGWDVPKHANPGVTAKANVSLQSNHLPSQSRPLSRPQSVPSQPSRTEGMRIPTSPAGHPSPLSRPLTSPLPGSERPALTQPRERPVTPPQGTLPPGTLPPGTLPQGTLPPGTLPPGTLLTGIVVTPSSERV